MKKLLIAGIALSVLPGCQLPELEVVVRKVNQAVGFQLLRYEKKLPQDVNDEIAKASDPDQAATASALAKANAELLSEMIQVVFKLDKVDDKGAFGGLNHTLNQGASLEGIYRGLVMGSRYRALEANSKAASPGVLKLFVRELVELQQTMKNPTEYQVEESRNAPSIEFPDGNVTPSQIGAKADTQEIKARKDKAAATNELLQIFIGASNFTLKRVLADEALKKFDELKSDTGELAQWYARLATGFADTKVDFGLELRNKPDFDFHFKFARTMASDRVKWEVLNRYHRYLNWAMDQER